MFLNLIVVDGDSHSKKRGIDQQGVNVLATNDNVPLCEIRFDECLQRLNKFLKVPFVVILLIMLPKKARLYVKERQEKDKIGLKPDKNGKRGEARLCGLAENGQESGDQMRSSRKGQREYDGARAWGDVGVMHLIANTSVEIGQDMRDMLTGHGGGYAGEQQRRGGSVKAEDLLCSKSMMNSQTPLDSTSQ
nr:hypothetical protein [Tanacetum cinerariifolium]